MIPAFVCALIIFGLVAGLEWDAVLSIILGIIGGLITWFIMDGGFNDGL